MMVQVVEMLGQLVESKVVQEALGYLLAGGVWVAAIWVVKTIRARMPGALVDRMWDAYLVEAAEYVWGLADYRVKNGLALSSDWRAKIVLEGIRRLEEKWARHEPRALSEAQLRAAQGELEDTIERAAGEVIGSR